MSPLGARRLAAAGTAGALAAVDLASKTLSPAGVHHDRGAGAMVVMAFVTLGLLLVVPRLPSAVVVAGAGIAAGGALGNLASLFLWGEGVPDPLVHGGVAFNLADVFVLGGDCVLLAGTAVFALRNRARLRESF